MKHLLPTCTLTLMAVAPLAGQSEAPAEESATEGVYAFAGVSAMKTVRKEFHPVIGATRRGLQVETPKGVKRSRFGQGGIYLEPALVTTILYASIEGVVLNFDNVAQAKREAALQNALDADVEYAQAKVDEINSTSAPTVAGQPQGMSKEAFTGQLSETISNARALQETPTSLMNQKADTIYLKFNITPEIDLEDAYGAVVVTHDNLLESERKGKRLSIVSMPKFGDLVGGIPNEVKLSVRTKEQVMSNLEVKLFLFSGEGLPVATNLSQNLRKLTSEELETLRSAIGK